MKALRHTMVFLTVLSMSLVTTGYGKTIVVKPSRVSKGIPAETVGIVESNLVNLLKANPADRVSIADEKNPNPVGEEYYKLSFRWSKGATQVSLKKTDADGKLIKPARVACHGRVELEKAAEKLLYGERKKLSAKPRPKPVMDGATVTFARVKWKAPSTQVFGDYEGGLKRGFPHGFGKIAFVTGERYEGKFNNGYMEGKGTYTWPNDIQFKGELEKGLPQGNGILTHPSGAGFEGYFVNGVRMGHGTVYYSNGTKFRGFWTNNVLDGYASYTLSNGRSYSYQFAMGKNVTKREPRSGGGPNTSIALIKTLAFVTQELGAQGEYEAAQTVGNINMALGAFHSIGIWTDD